MDEEQAKTISKFLSLVLRHNPEKIGLQLDTEGWADVNELIGKANQAQRSLDRNMLEEVVYNNDKQRFAFNADKSRIRASQGHSVTVELKLEALPPPEFLYHGTVAKFLDAIKAEGLQKMNRHHVHLSKDRELAQLVGSRRGKPVVLSIRAGQMSRDGILFYVSDNGVWLTDQVPVHYIEF